MNQTRCYCGNRESFAECCQPFVSGRGQAPTPEQVMRSRYSAFATGNIDYLIATHHPSRRKPDDHVRLAQSADETEWVGLRVLASETVSDSRQRGFVEFVAFYRDKLFSTEPGLAEEAARSAVGVPNQLHEKSEFIQEDGKWYYLQGLNLPPIRISRNDPCWCGSGKKLKQCHGRGK